MCNPYHCIFMMMLTARMLNAMFKTSLGLFGKSQTIDSEVIGVLPKIILFTSVIASIFCIVILPYIFHPLWI